MRNILKRFSNKIHTNSSMILDGVIGIQDYEEQLSNYERCVYGKFDNNVEISKISSQREKLLLSRKQTFIERSLTISGAHILLNLLTSLNTFKEILEKEYLRELWWENVLGSRFGDAKPYKSALDKIERAYNDLFKEASVVVVVISSTLKDWYDRKLPREALDIADPTQKRL